MSSLYEIEQALLEAVDQETGEINSEVFDQLMMERKQKIEGIALWIKNLKADAAAFKAEKEAFADRQKAAENKAASLMQYLTTALAGEKFETTKVRLSFRKSESLEISEGAAIPAEYLKQKEPDIDKVELKKAVKAGLVLDGVQLVEKQNLQIK